jgi:beta-amylase
VGCGPCGELRYPSYPLAPREHYPSGWRWPGIGELQCYDQGMLARMAADLDRAAPPAGAGEYNDAPDDTRFWAAPGRSGGCLPSLKQLWRRGRRAGAGGGAGGKPGKERFDSESGARFLAWYSAALVAHGGDVMRAARRVFGGGMRLACKVSGIHWLRAHPSHAAEATAGYVGTYLDAVCTMLKQVPGGGGGRLVVVVGVGRGGWARRMDGSDG